MNAVVRRIGFATQRAWLSSVLAIPTRDLKTAFTERSSGKYRATSGESRTRFVPCWNRFAYLPRTPPLSLERSYSERKSSSRSLLFAFFIISSFLSCRFSCADDPNVVSTVCVCDHKHVP